MGTESVFGGSVDTQQVLPFGTPEEVRADVARCVGVLGRAGGYVLAVVHNIQPKVPPENVIAMVDATCAFRLDSEEQPSRKLTPA
jgi:uroporphyrinogen decarboxylase